MSNGCNFMNVESVDARVLVNRLLMIASQSPKCACQACPGS